ncbi:MAG: DNA polymerase IV, partial [Raoultibacter sp.]
MRCDIEHNGISESAGGITDAVLPPWNGAAILLVDLDAFFASVEQLDHPAWRGKPVIVGGDPSKHGVVSTASYEARVFGVRSAMPASQAARLCPDAIWTHGHYDRYREMSNEIMRILVDESPAIQQVSIDEAFLDISPTAHNTEHPIRIAQRIQSRVEKLGVTCSIGLGTTKTIAKIGSDMDKPSGLTIVYPGREKDFLAPLPIRTMSGIGPAAEQALKAHNIQTLGDLAKADEALMRRIFGKNAPMIAARSNGGDLTPVAAGDPLKSVSNEITFADDLKTQNEVEAGIATMAAKVGRRLRKKQLKGS